MPTIPRTANVLGQGWQEFRAAWKTATAFLLFFALLNIAVLSPLIAWGLDAIVRTAGAAAITNADLVAFALSPTGIAFLLAAGTVHLATLQAQAGGLTLLAADVAAGRRPSLQDAVARKARRLPAFLKLSLLQTAVVLALVAGLVACLAVIHRWLLGEHDINYYLSERPREWQLAILLAGGMGAIAAVGLVWLLARWLFAVPMLLLGNLGPLDALRAAWRATRVQWTGLVRVLGTWWIGMAILSAALSATGWFLAGRLFDWAGYLPARVLAVVTLILGTGLAASAAMTVVGLGIHQFVVMRLSLPHLAATTEPDAPTAGTPARSRRMTMAWAGLMGILVLSGTTGWLELRDMEMVESVTVTAHRGSSARAPENTLAAVQLAIADGADMAEIDVQTTTDGAVVVFHDADLMRRAGDARRLRDLSLAEAKEADVGRRFDPRFAGERIPTLAEVIEVARGRINLNIELKYNGPDPNLAAKVIEVLRREAFGTHCILTSLDAGALAEVQRLAPELRLGQIVTASVGNLNRLPGDILSVNKNAASRQFIQRARKAGKAVHVWTVNQPGDMLLMIERGATSLITDRPDVAVRLLRERAELSDAEKLALRFRVLFGAEQASTAGTHDTEPQSP